MSASGMEAHLDPFETFMPRQRLVVSPNKRHSRQNFWSCWRTGSRQFVEQRFGAAIPDMHRPG
jgi:hypothetical protein